MKKILKYIVAIVLISTLSSCREGYTDSIIGAEQGTDKIAPKIEIGTATRGKLTLPFTQNSTNYDFEYIVSDDVELSSVELFLDGVKLESYNKFIDYRGFKETYTKNLNVGTHIYKVIATDLTGKSASLSYTFEISNKYVIQYVNEKAYFSFFSGNIFTDLISEKNPTVMGKPVTISGGYAGGAYQGATDSYLTFPLSGLYSNKGISFTFWYKVNATLDRSGIITINDNNNDSDENRKQGLRLFREGSATAQRIKLNVGLGNGESWNDGAELTVNNSWVHIAVTVSPTETKIYFNGELKNTSTYTSPFDFSTSSTIVIGSGAPSFTYWGHLSDLSLIDELRIYDTALEESQVKSTM